MKINKKVVIWSIIFFILGILIPSSEKEVVVEKVVSCNNCTEIIGLYDEVLGLDDQAFQVSISFVELIAQSGRAGLNRDIEEIERITGVITNGTDKVQILATKKQAILNEINKLK